MGVLFMTPRTVHVQFPPTSLTLVQIADRIRNLWALESPPKSAQPTPGELWDPDTSRLAGEKNRNEDELANLEKVKGLDPTKNA